MLRPLLTLLLLLAAAATAAAQQPRFDPVLRMLLDPDVRAAVESALRADPLPPPERAPFGGAVALDAEGPAGAARVGVLVRLRSPAAVAELRAAGAEVGSVAGDVATARIPLASLPALSAAAAIEWVEAAHLVQRTNDVATQLVRADRVRSRVGEGWQGFAGQGVIVAMYDTGLDYQHEDFRDAAGRTRLLGLWDQTVGGTPPPGFGYGVFCDVPSLNAGTCPQRDNEGHGTHVAGSAAGDGSAAAGVLQYRYAGVAPAADLLIVKGGEVSFPEDRIIDGIAWVFQEATRLGRPAVVNLSLGGHFGPHDGTRLFERAIDNLSEPGRIVVASAGNEGANASATPVTRPLIHAMGPSSGTRTYTIEVPDYPVRPGVGANSLRISFWYRSADRLTLEVVRPDGSSVAAPFGTVQQGASAAGGIHIDNASEGPNPLNGDHHALIVIENFGGSGAPAPGVWTVRATATPPSAGATHHFWIFSNTISARGAQGFTNSHLVGSPGTARRAVTVGAFVSRLRWTSTDGNTYGFVGPEEEVGDIATFSSGGPTRDGRLKPEITAPGRVILSSLSTNASPPIPLIVPGDRHWALQGTSMSAPMVTGAVALLLQRAASLTPENVVQIFSTSSIRDAFTQRSYVTGDPGGIPNFQWGWGKLDVEAALAAAAPFAQVSALVVNAEPLTPVAPPSTERGTVVPLLRLVLRADGPEPLDVTALGFDLFGEDPGARLLLVVDTDGDGQIGPQDPPLVGVPAPLQPGDTVRVVVPLQLRIPAGQAVGLIAAVEMSGAAPHLSPLQAWFVPEETRAVGVESGQPSPLRQPTAVVATPELRPTLLAPGEVFVLSENPVRGARLIMNFREAPSLASIFTVGGRRVIDLLPLVEEEARLVWDLTNQQGTPVAPGVYLLVVRVGDQTIRERLIISRPAGGRQ